MELTQRTTTSMQDFILNFMSLMNSSSSSSDREWIHCTSKEASISSWDRYNHDFEDISILGKGAFGEVKKARHKLDGREYAIKKIPLRLASSKECQNLLREVKILSQLDHPNVARYYFSWFQMDKVLIKPHRNVDSESSSCYSNYFDHPHIQENMNYSSHHLLANYNPPPRDSLSVVFQQEEASSFANYQSPPEEHSDSLSIVFEQGESSSNSSSSYSRRVKIHDPPSMPSLSSNTFLCSKNKEYVSADNVTERCSKKASLKYDSFPNSSSTDGNDMRETNSLPSLLASKFSSSEGVHLLQNNLSEETSNFLLRRKSYRTSFTEQCFTSSFSESKYSQTTLSTNALIPYTPNSSPKTDFLLIPTLYIQMELGQESLQSWLEKRNDNISKKNFSWNEKEILRHIKIFRNILESLEYIHSKGLIHRDIKPANIILSENGHKALLSDFGLAKFLQYEMSDKKCITGKCGSRKSEAYVVGTPTYSAPEITKGFIYNNKIDIYSLGIILFELLYPFGSMYERAKLIEDLKLHRYIEPKCASKWGWFSQVVLSMTENDPSSRPSAAELLQLATFHHEANDLRRSNSLKCQYSLDTSLQNYDSSLAKESIKNKTRKKKVVKVQYKTLKYSKSVKVTSKNVNPKASHKTKNFSSGDSFSSSSSNPSQKQIEEIEELKQKVIELEKKIEELQMNL